MKMKDNKIYFRYELTDEEKNHIKEIFIKDMVPKLKEWNGRTGTLNCEFAGEKYRNWNIRFKSVGSDFDIIDFEYDEGGRGL